MAQEQKVPKRIARTVLNALKGGVVPRIGLPYIAVGRKKEIDALLSDIEIVSEGGASVRFITGRYGSGKSFLRHPRALRSSASAVFRKALISGSVARSGKSSSSRQDPFSQIQRLKGEIV